MSDPSDSKKPSIPDWQLAPSSKLSDGPSSEQKPSTTNPPPAPRSTLLEQASRFLEEESIRDAPTDRKVSFLESKGLQNDEIQTVLGISRNPEASSKSEVSPSETKEASEPSPPQSESEPSPTPSSQSTATSSPSRDIPPVITYPEFLLRSQKPPPLITADRLLYTLYINVGLAAVLYGTSKYLVAPMLSTLTSARHELSETTLSNLQKLNEKLIVNVSRIPPIQPHNPSHPSQSQADADDAESYTSDPTELFHRDIATQTTPTLTRSPSASSTDSSQSQSHGVPKRDIVASHAQRLNVIHSHLSEFVATEDASVTSLEENKELMSELQTYLDTLTYGSTTSGYVNGMYGSIYGGAGHDSGTGGNGQGQAGDDDAISKFKTEIRGVKGALLSARNFPSGAPRVR